MLPSSIFVHLKALYEVSEPAEMKFVCFVMQYHKRKKKCQWIAIQRQKQKHVECISKKCIIHIAKTTHGKAANNIKTIRRMKGTENKQKPFL